jgi:uncharacterized protein YceK
VRKIPVLLTVVGLAALSLSGCASIGSVDCSRPAAADAAMQSRVDVGGAVGSAPQVSFDTPMHIDDPEVWDVETGAGTPITSDDQLVALDIALYSGTSGKGLVSTAFDGDQSRVFAMSQWVQTFPEIEKLLHCATPGSRVVLALPPSGVADEAKAQLGLTNDESSLVVVDVAKTYLTRATGSTVFNDAHNMPTVVRAPSGQPGIIVPDATAPKQITVQTLIKGDGAALKDSDTARVNYTGVPWEQSAKVFETTWGSDAASVPVGSATQPGFAEALKGQTVGSQVLVVVPADKVGTGSTSAPAGKTLVYVIDILGVDAASAATTQ